MSRKRGLGQPETPPEASEDLLNSVFGAPAPEKGTDTPAPAPAAKKTERMAKYFQIDKTLAKELKIYAVRNELKEQEVIERALRLLFEQVE